MRILVFLIVSQILVLAQAGAAELNRQEVQVVEPYIEMHTGPGIGYPVFFVVERGQWVEILRQQTDWFEIRSRRGRVGWAQRRAMEKTLTHAGETLKVKEVALGDYHKRRWEMGILTGDFGGANLVSAYGGWVFTPNLSTELTIAQTLGDFSSSFYVSVNLVGQPFPEWRISPYFTLGTGALRTEPKATLVQTVDRTDSFSNVGLGIRTYLTRRFILRLEYKNYVVFTSTDDNEEIDEWKAGITVFF